MRARSFVVAALLAGSVVTAAPARKPASKKAPPPAADSCATCLERGAVLDPSLFADTRIYEPEVGPAYEIARKYPATLDRLHCFCECQESMMHRHKTLLTCFTSEHAAGCGICQREAILAARLKDQGLADEQIELTVESAAKTDGHPPTFGRGL